MCLCTSVQMHLCYRYTKLIIALFTLGNEDCAIPDTCREVGTIDVIACPMESNVNGQKRRKFICPNCKMEVINLPRHMRIVHK